MNRGMVSWISIILVVATKDVTAWIPLFRRQAPATTTVASPTTSWKPLPPTILHPTPEEKTGSNNQELWHVKDQYSIRFRHTLGDGIDAPFQFFASPSQQDQQQQQGRYPPSASPPTTRGNPSTSIIANALNRHEMNDYDNRDPRISYTDAGTLQLHFAATGWTMQAALAGAFGTAWFSALVPATTTVAAVPILLPFYLAGGLVAKQALVDPFTSTTLSLGQYAWSLDTSRYKGPSQCVASGATSHVARAAVVERVSSSSSSADDRSRRYTYDLQLILFNKNKPVTVYRDLDSLEEAERLSHVINQQLARMRALQQEDESLFVYNRLE